MNNYSLKPKLHSNLCSDFACHEAAFPLLSSSRPYDLLSNPFIPTPLRGYKSLSLLASLDISGLDDRDGVQRKPRKAVLVTASKGLFLRPCSFSNKAAESSANKRTVQILENFPRYLSSYLTTCKSTVSLDKK